MHIGIDLGGTKTESIIIDKNGKEIERVRKDTPKNYNGTLDSVCELVNYLENKYSMKSSDVLSPTFNIVYDYNIGNIIFNISELIVTKFDILISLAIFLKNVNIFYIY